MKHVVGVCRISSNFTGIKNFFPQYFVGSTHMRTFTHQRDEVESMSAHNSE